MVKQSMLNITDYRDSCASTDDEDDELFLQGLPSNQSQEIVDDDSESEFNKILQMCRRRHEISGDKIEENSQKKPRFLKKPAKVFDSEYDSLPAIEQLNIQVREETEFKKFGVVESHISFLAKIRPDKDAPHLGYDTILFDHEKKPAGEIFEIFGTVADTLYALRFNDEGEALARLPIGEVIYYANEDNAMTKPVFPKELEKLKSWDRIRPSGGDSSSSEEFFSDDEEEKCHLVRKRRKTREDRPLSELASNTNNGIPKKRSKFGTNGLGRPCAVFHPANSRPMYVGPYPVPYNNYMPMYPQHPPNCHLPVAIPMSRHWFCPPPPPPLYSSAAFFTSPPHCSAFPNQNPRSQHQFFNQRGYLPQRPHFGAHTQQNSTQK